MKMRATILGGGLAVLMAGVSALCGASQSGKDYAVMRAMGDEVSRLYAAQAGGQAADAAAARQTAAVVQGAPAGQGAVMKRMGASWQSLPQPRGLALPPMTPARQSALLALSLDQLLALAKSGDADAMMMVGLVYEKKFDAGDAAAFDKAVYWLERAAYAGQMLSMSRLGQLFILNGKNKKNQEALLLGTFWLQRAVVEGSPDSDYLLGASLFVFGKGYDICRSLPILARAAEAGDTQSAEILAGLYLETHTQNGVRIPADTLKAYYFHAFAQGKPDAAQALRRRLDERDNGDDRAHNALLAQGDSKTGLFAVPGLTPAQFQTLLKAAQKGDDVDACASVGNAYYYGYGTPVDMAESLRWMEKAAKMGDINCQMFAGVRYLMGDHAPVDGKKAVQYLTMGAERGDPYCNFILAEAYAAGQAGLPKSNALSARYHVRAAELGVPYSQFVTAMWMLVNPTAETPRNPAQGMRFAREAAERGDVRAQMLLAMALVGHAEGVRANPDEGLYWLQRVADTGDTSSLTILGDELFKRYQFAAAAHVYWADATLNASDHAAWMLASLYKSGTGIAKDPAKAAYWFRKAAASGGPKAAAAAQELAQWKDAPAPAANDAMGPVTNLDTLGLIPLYPDGKAPAVTLPAPRESEPAAAPAPPEKKIGANHRYTSTPRFCRTDAPPPEPAAASAPADTTPAPQATPEDGVATAATDVALGSVSTNFAAHSGSVVPVSDDEATAHARALVEAIPSTPTVPNKAVAQATPEDGVAALKEAFANPEILDMLAREARAKGDTEAAQFYEQRAAQLRAAKTAGAPAPSPVRD